MICHLNEIIKERKILSPPSFVPYLNSDNVLIEKKKIHRLLQTLILKSRLLYKQHTYNSIISHTKQRCLNYQDNPKTIIDSLLNRSKRVIKLNRLIIKDNFDNKMLITDPTQIKSATIYHF